MMPGDRGRCSTRRRHRTRLPVPMDRIPTLRPMREARKPAPPPIRTFFKRMWARFPVRFAFVPGSCNWMWGDGATNPATGLPLYGGVDSAGNPYGVGSIHHTPHHDWHATHLDTTKPGR